MTFYSIESPAFDDAWFEWQDEPERMYRWHISAGVPVTDLSRLPTTARQKDKRKLYDTMFLGGLRVVSGNFRQAVEEFEPGRHQLFPVELQQKDGTPHEGTWFILNICARFPCLIPKEPLKYKWGASTAGGGELGGGYQEVHYGSLRAREAFVSKPAAEGHHLWQSWVFRRPAWICSEPLFLRLKELCRGGRTGGEKFDILGLETEPMDDTDEPWIAAIQAAPWRDWALAHPEDVAKHGYAKYL